MHVFRYLSVERDAPELLESWLTLRRDLYLTSGLVSSENLPASGVYTDVYDDYSEHILMYDAAQPNTAIGTCRIIDGRRGPLQVYHQFGVDHGHNALEVSGFAVSPIYRRTFVTLGCYWLVYRRACRGDYSEVHFEVEKPFRRTLASIGIPLVDTAQPRFVYNAWNIPVRVTPSEVVAHLREADNARANTTRFADLFQRPFDGTLEIATIFQTPEVVNDPPEETA